VGVFKGKHGMRRSLATGLLIDLDALPASHMKSWAFALFLFAPLAISTMRMHRFGTLYARELFIQFLGLPAAASTGGTI
jgi:hypothetical protein